MAGILIGGGGTIAATEGKEVELPQGTVLRVRVDSPATSTRRARLRQGRSEGPPLRVRLATSFIAPRAAAIVLVTSRSVCAADRNHASNCDGGG